MKDTLKRGWALVLVLILVSSVCLLFAARKQGMFIDELYTYGLSNSSYHPFLSTTGERYGSLDHTVVTRQELLDYVSINGDEGFDFGSVYYNQVNDVHPPLYYWLFNIASTFARDSFSKWPPLILDWLIYLGCVVMLYKLVQKLGGSRYNAAVAAVLYGLSTIGLSTMIMIRMYVLLTLLTVVLMYFIADLMQHFHPRTCVFVGLTLLAGLMTQYYFVFYAFFLCGAYVVWALLKRQYKALAWFVPCALIGALSLLLVFPAALRHLFAEDLVSGGSASSSPIIRILNPRSISSFIYLSKKKTSKTRRCIPYAYALFSVLSAMDSGPRSTPASFALAGSAASFPKCRRQASTTALTGTGWCS